MRSIKNWAAMMVLAMTMTMCMSAQTPVAAKGIILLDRSSAVQTSQPESPQSDENADATGIIITTTLTSISIVLTNLI
jgi:hypothetical protein